MKTTLVKEIRRKDIEKLIELFNKIVRFTQNDT